MNLEELGWQTKLLHCNRDDPQTLELSGMENIEFQWHWEWLVFLQMVYPSYKIIFSAGIIS